MKNNNILVPGGGGFASVNAIKSLRLLKNKKLKLITTDSNPLSVGFYLADNGYVLPKINETSFMSKAIEIIKKEQIDLILPTSGFDIIPYANKKSLLSEMGVTCFFSDLDVINLCDNKSEFYSKCFKKGFGVPEVFNNPEKNIKNEYVFAKPIKGKGSRDVFLIKNKNQLEYVKSNFENMIYTEYLPGKEYTVDVLLDLKHNPIVAVPRERIETKAGISFKGKIVKNKSIVKKSIDLAKFLKIKGPCCIQLKEDKFGKLKLIEVNPRMGGGTIMATNAGVNFCELILKNLNKDTISEEDLNYDEITVLRYYEEIIINNNK